MKLQSRVCEILEIEQPIVLAGMGGASSPALAAAVSNAGGLGIIDRYLLHTSMPLSTVQVRRYVEVNHTQP